MIMMGFGSRTKYFKVFTGVLVYRCTSVNKLYSGLHRILKKRGCYLHSVQHSYENRSCKPEIKYFSSVNHQFTGVNCSVYSRLQVDYRCKLPSLQGVNCWITQN